MAPLHGSPMPQHNLPRGAVQSAMHHTNHGPAEALDGERDRPGRGLSAGSRRTTPRETGCGDEEPSSS